jgi:hypothetical protein
VFSQPDWHRSTGASIFSILAILSDFEEHLVEFLRSELQEYVETETFDPHSGFPYADPLYSYRIELRLWATSKTHHGFWQI